MTDEPKEARAFAEETLALYGTLPSYSAMLDREGYDGPGDTAIIGDEETVSQQLHAVAALGVEELSAFVFARTSEEDARTRKLLGSMARAAEAI